jgi:translation initiation factor 2B subunit (eIF-2B alpha/beta/delta family)
MPEGLERLVDRIKKLEIQGAMEIAVESLKFLRSYSKKKGFGKDFNNAMNKLE